MYYLSLARFFPFLSRFLFFFFQINIIIMIPCYEYVAPLFLSAASNVFLFFFIFRNATATFIKMYTYYV